MGAGEASRGSNLQDILRLLTLWFTHGSAPDVERALEEGFGHISIDTWLVVIPQVTTLPPPPSCHRWCSLASLLALLRVAHTLHVRHSDQENPGLSNPPADCAACSRVQVIARIHDPQGVVRRLIQSLLICVGRHHPQALMYPLLVACKSQSGQRRSAAMSVVDNVRQHSATLVEQAQLVRPQQPPRTQIFGQ